LGVFHPKQLKNNIRNLYNNFICQIYAPFLAKINKLELADILENKVRRECFAQKRTPVGK
jgi:hypothetical protein